MEAPVVRNCARSGAVGRCAAAGGGGVLHLPQVSALLQVQTSLGAIPGPGHRSGNKFSMPMPVPRPLPPTPPGSTSATRSVFSTVQADQQATRAYTGKPTYYAQIMTSIRTVFTGFLLATLVAVPWALPGPLVDAHYSAAINPLVRGVQAGPAAGLAAHRQLMVSSPPPGVTAARAGVGAFWSPPSP